MSVCLGKTHLLRKVRKIVTSAVFCDQRGILFFAPVCWLSLSLSAPPSLPLSPSLSVLCGVRGRWW